VASESFRCGESELSQKQSGGIPKLRDAALHMVPNFTKSWEESKFLVVPAKRDSSE